MSDAPELIKQHRAKRGWSQTQLADRVGCNEKTIQRIESGKGCSVDMLKSIAIALEIEPDVLLLSSDSPAVRRRARRRVRDGFVCMQLLLDSEHTYTRVSVVRDPNDEKLHEAIIAVCEVIDSLKQHKSPPLVPTRVAYEGARSIGNALRQLEAHGWLLELEESYAEVFARTHDGVVFWIFHFRQAETGETNSAALK
jgi:transcriptional regulator with XRE-family HTH domain